MVVEAQLKKWNMAQYVGAFISNGYDNTEGWIHLTLQDLANDMQMKKGHAKVFVKKVKAANNGRINSNSNSNSDSDENNRPESLSSPSSLFSSSISLQRELTVYGFINQLIHKISHSHPHSIVTRTVFPMAIYSVIHLYYGRIGSYEAIGIGKNEWCQMGFGSGKPDTSLPKFTPLSALSALISNPSDIYVGNGRLLVKDNENHLHCAGFNMFGDCGVNSTNRYTKSFTRIHSNEENPSETVDDIQFVTSSLSAYHTIVMTSTGDLYSFGSNIDGQLCLGFQMHATDANNKRFAQRVPQSTTNVFDGQSIVSITAGSHHCLFLTENGTVYGCGSNSSSQLGFPNSQMTHSFIPIRVEFPFPPPTESESENVSVRITRI